MRKTKIIATLGPATESPEMLRTLIETGVNCFRLNMSHAPHDWVRAIVPRMAHVQPEAIHSCLDERAEHLGRFRGGPECGDDFRFAHNLKP